MAGIANDFAHYAEMTDALRGAHKKMVAYAVNVGKIGLVVVAMSGLVKMGLTAFDADQPPTAAQWKEMSAPLYRADGEGEMLAIAEPPVPSQAPSVAVAPSPP
ncbi:MAG: hypothetical protein KDJ15_00420 [Alphaproteobacteria bacterium]|nr:hypothetical protein [Alphaproteobacteria bacterium]